MDILRVTGSRGRRRPVTLCRAGAAVLAGVVSLLAPTTSRAAYAPPDRPGPPLSIPAEKLPAALACSGPLAGDGRGPVLLVHGTGLTPEENWAAGYQPGLNSLGIPWCTVALPDRGTADVQLNAEYVVYAIREMHRRAGQPIDVIGASQGGMLPRWALRFWPDVRPLVDDLVALAPSNHGTSRGHLSCRRECFPAWRQQIDQSNFIRALNSITETFPGISYTIVYTLYDEVISPPTSSELHGPDAIANVAVQDICPLDTAEHLVLAMANATAFALAMDALSNSGPASAQRVRGRGCLQPGIPGYNPARFAALTQSHLSNRDNGAARVAQEPPLRCYVTGSCAGGTQLFSMRLSLRPRRVTARRTARILVTARSRIDGRMRAVRGAVVRAGGLRAHTNRRGRAVLRVRFLRPGRKPVTARKPGFAQARATIRVRRAR